VAAVTNPYQPHRPNRWESARDPVAARLRREASQQLPPPPMWKPRPSLLVRAWRWLRANLGVHRGF